MSGGKGSLGEGDDVTLEAGDFFSGLLLAVDVVEVGADPEEDAAGADRREVSFLESAGLHQVLDAIGFGEDPAFMEGIEEDLAL